MQVRTAASWVDDALLPWRVCRMLAGYIRRHGPGAIGAPGGPDLRLVLRWLWRALRSTPQGLRARARGPAPLISGEPLREHEIRRRPTLTPASCPAGTLFGFGPTQPTEQIDARWSRPIALAGLYLERGGKTQILIVHLGIDREARERTLFFVDEKPVEVSHRAGATAIALDRPAGPLRLGWITPGRELRGEEDPVGLAVVSISYGPGADPLELESAPAPPPELAGARRLEPAGIAGRADYFMHIPKSAGTSLNEVLFQGFGAAASFFDPGRLYHPESLPERLGRRRVAGRRFASGHFGAELLAAWPDPKPRAHTILREPVSRLRSLHSFLHSNRAARTASGPEAGELPLAEWLRDASDARFWTAGQLLDGLPACSGSDAVAGLLKEREQEVLERLAEFEVVGLFDRFEESFELICHRMGVLPPPVTAHKNPNLSTRLDLDEQALDPATRDLLDLDRKIYAQGQEQFEGAIARLRAEVGYTGAGDGGATLRELVRAAWFAREAESFSETAAAEPLLWIAGDPLPGEGIHGIERAQAGRLVWTGPEEAMNVYMPLAAGRRWRIRVALDPVTPHARVAEARVAINGAEEQLAETDGGGPLSSDGSVVVGAELDVPGPGEPWAPLSRLQLISPTGPLGEDTRQLGLAVRAFSLEPA